MSTLSKLVEAYGGVGIRVKKKEEVEDAIKKAIEDKQPCPGRFLDRQGRKRLSDGALRLSTRPDARL